MEKTLRKTSDLTVSKGIGQAVNASKLAALVSKVKGFEFCYLSGCL